MSGLALFFHKTSLESIDDNDNSNSSVVLDENSTAPRRSITYDTSLVDPAVAASSSSSHDTLIRNNVEEDAVPWKTYAEWKQWQKNVVQDFCYHRIFAQDDDDDDEQQPLQDDINSKRSSNNDKENAAGYKVDPLAAAALDGRQEESNGLSDEEYHSDDEPESAMFETQQPEVHVATIEHPPDDDDTRGETTEGNSSSINKNGPPAIIPCISETLGSVHYVADLDLQAAMVHLSRLSLDRIWPLRSTRRGAVKFQPWNFQRHRRPLLGRFLSWLRQEQQQQQDSSTRKSLQQQEILALVSASALWHPGEDDGPLSIVYHDVLTMEFHELLEDDYGSDTGCGVDGAVAAAPSLRRRAEAPFLTTTATTIATKTRPNGNEPVTTVVPRRRLKIFLYDSYARDMQTILAIISASPQGASKVVVQLQNVPSWCIFPYNSQHHGSTTLPRSSDWYDSHGDLAPYCICIGDDCLVKYPKETAPLCLTSLPPNDRSESTEKDATLSSMRFDHVDLCMHVGLVVTRRRGSSHNQQPSADETNNPKDQRAASSSNPDDDGAAWLVLREWNVTAKGLREVKPNKRGHDPDNSSDDDDAAEHDDVNQPTSGRSVFGEWYSEYQEREQQQQQHQQPTCTMDGGDNSTVIPAGITNTINDDTVAIAETAVVDTNALPQETQARERQTTATSSPSENDLPQQRSDKNAQEQALSVDGSRILLQAEQNAQVTVAATTTNVSQQSAMSTTGPSIAGAGPLQPAAAATATEEDRGNRAGEIGSVNQGHSSHQSGQVPTVNGQLQPDGVPSPRKRQRNMTQYCPMQDLRRVLEEKKAESTLVQADVYGVVLGFGSPTRTKRGEWMMAVALVDESLALPGEKGEIHTVNLNIFSKRIDEMPQIRFAGDVLRAHRIKVQEWNEEIQLMGLRASSYVVFRADSNNRTQTDNLTVLPTAKNEFAWTEEDKDRFIKLWQWGQRRLFSHPTMKEPQSFKLSKMLWHTDDRVETYQDSIARGDVTLLVCAILEMAPEKKTSATPRGFLRVWDGTGPPTSDPFPDDCNVNGYNASRDGDPPSCVVEKLAGMIQELRRIRQNPNLQEPKALTGRVANVAIWEEPFWELVQKAVKVGSFIRLRNVHDTRIPNGIRRYLMVFGKSYLTPLPNMTYEVVRMLEAHNDRLLNNEQLNPSSGVLPLGRAQGDSIRRSNVRVSLASLVTQPVSTLFSGRVCIVGLIPSLNELASGEHGGLNQICGPGRNFAVQLSDAYGRPPLDVILSGDSLAAARIFGMSPDEAIKEQNHQQVMSHLARITSNLNDSTPSCWWNAKVRSVALEGAKYFVLESIDSL